MRKVLNDSMTRRARVQEGMVDDEMDERREGYVTGPARGDAREGYRAIELNRQRLMYARRYMTGARKRGALHR